MDARLLKHVERIPPDIIGGYFTIMDTLSRFVLANTPALRLIGHSHLSQVQGSTYHSMPSAASENAEEFIREDSRVTQANITLKILSFQCPERGDGTVMLGEKSPVIINNKTLGVATNFIDISDLRLVDLARFLLKSDSHFYSKNKKPFQYSFVLDTHYRNYSLSERQSECLFLLLRGKTSKEMAKILDLSYRTVEGYINEVKIKMQCDSKPMIIEKSISEGLLNFIPESLMETLSELHQP